MILNNACDYYEHICKCIVAYLLNYTHQNKFSLLINAPCVHKIAISMNVTEEWESFKDHVFFLPKHIVAFIELHK